MIVLVTFTSVFLMSCTSISRIFSKSGKYLLVEVEDHIAGDKEELERVVQKLNLKAYVLSNGKATTEHELVRKPNQILIDLIDYPKDPEHWKQFKARFLEESVFEIREVVSQKAPSPVKTFPTKEGAAETSGEDHEVVALDRASLSQYIVVQRKPIINGDDLRDANAFFGEDGKYSIQFSLKDQGAKKFGRWTAKNKNKYIASVYNGRAVSVAYIRVRIEDGGVVNGNFTKEIAEDLARKMRSGDFPYKLTLIMETEYGE